jgi:tRNA(fMet)-specific endonuclease VapC
MTEPLYLLDTNILLALIRGKDFGRKIEARFGLNSAKQKPLLSVVSCGEIRVLSELNSWGPAKKSVLEIALADLVIVDIHHPQVLEAYVLLDVASQRHSGGARNMGKNDLWIAACAAATSAILLTSDRDFEHLVPHHLAAEVVLP